MRIRRISIAQWRHFENIQIALGDDAPLVCIVGANGTGKSHLLELIAACAHRLGLAPGVETSRGDPFNDPHEFSLQFYLAPGVSAAVDSAMAGDEAAATWDRTLTVNSARQPAQAWQRIEAGGVPDPNTSQALAGRVVEQLRRSESVHFLSLDADRAYPKKNININEVAQAYEIDWENLEYTRGRSFRSTTTLYDEWLKYFLAQENQSGTRLMQAMRRARKTGDEPPPFQDHFANYASALQKVLPHVQFTGVNSRSRTLLFDTTGLELSFNQLSGGEREIAFLIGQIDRFRLTHGLFLLDEPELHLNADLIRQWVAYLTSTIESGQVWLATHSLEAVEAAGQEATFVLERNEESRRVDSLARLDARPVLSALSRAVGTPAFSISQLRFVFVEGEENVGERERFLKLAGMPQDVRFMECGSCQEVTRRVDAVRALARNAQTGIRIGGVVDRDFRNDRDADALAAEKGVLVLPVHEIENLFLHPMTVARLGRQNGQEGMDPEEAIRLAADLRAGAWIFQHATATRLARNLPEIGPAAKEHAKRATWEDVQADRFVPRVLELAGWTNEASEALRNILNHGAETYARIRVSPELWKRCEGKQVLAAIAPKLGFAGPMPMTQAAFALWAQEPAAVPAEVLELREYIDRL